MPYEWIKAQVNPAHVAEITDAMARLSTEHPSEPPARETLSPEPGAAPHAPGPAPDHAPLWVALKALAGPTEPEAVDEAVRVARDAARPLAAALLALEASGGVLGLALAGLPEPARENMEQVLNAEEQVLNAEEQAILASNVADVRAKWAVVLRKAAGAFRIPGEVSVVNMQR